jgi:hypothetical protein
MTKDFFSAIEEISSDFDGHLKFVINLLVEMKMEHEIPKVNRIAKGFLNVKKIILNTLSDTPSLGLGYDSDNYKYPENWDNFAKSLEFSDFENTNEFNYPKEMDSDCREFLILVVRFGEYDALLFKLVNETDAHRRLNKISSFLNEADTIEQLENPYRVLIREKDYNLFEGFKFRNHVFKPYDNDRLDLQLDRVKELKDFIKSRPSKPLLIGQNTKEDVSNAWFLVGIEFARGSIQQKLRENKSYKAIGSEMFPQFDTESNGKKDNSTRKIISESQPNSENFEQDKNTKNLFNNLSHVKIIFDYCLENEIDTIPQFKDFLTSHNLIK